MKNLLIPLICLFAISNATFSQTEEFDPKKLGLVSHLTTVKMLAEFKMISLAKDPSFISNNEKTKNFLSEYNLLRLSVERFINQLSADLYTANKPKIYKKINAYVKGGLDSLPSKLSIYQKALFEIDQQLSGFMINTYSSMLSGPGLGDVTGLTEFAYGVFTDIRDNNAKKAGSIANQLNTLKLDKVKDLIEPKQKDKK